VGGKEDREGGREGCEYPLVCKEREKELLPSSSSLPPSLPPSLLPSFLTSAAVFQSVLALPLPQVALPWGSFFRSVFMGGEGGREEGREGVCVSDGTCTEIN